MVMSILAAGIALEASLVVVDSIGHLACSKCGKRLGMDRAKARRHLRTHGKKPARAAKRHAFVDHPVKLPDWGKI